MTPGPGGPTDGPLAASDALKADPDAGRLRSPSAARNAEPVRKALAAHLADRSGLVLEVGSGSGEHIAGWAAAFPALDWQPSEPDPRLRASVAAWRAHADRPNLRAPIALDVTGAWPDLGPLTAVVSLNMIHIAPWAAAEGLVAGAAQALGPGGLLILYGPFREGGAHTGEGNVAFDARLRAQNPDWGIRDLEAVAALASDAGLRPAGVTPMPADNRLVAFAKGRSLTPR